MNYLGRVIGNLRVFYSGINSATLTGAIDVIVVEQEDGTFKCSPFHVRFGKLGVLRSKEKVVDIEVNGVPVPIRMKLGDSGEAFFVQETYDFDSDDENLATSPLPASPQLSDGETSTRILMRGHMDESGLNNNNNDLILKAVVDDVAVITSTGEVIGGVNESLPKETVGSNKSGDDCKNRKRRKRRRRNQGSKSSIVLDPTYAVDSKEPAAESQEGIFKMDELNAVTHALENLDLSNEHTQSVNQSRQNYHRDFYSDTEVDATITPNNTRPTTPIQSDSEYEIKKIQKSGEDEEVGKWAWGELPSTGNTTPAITPMGPQTSSIDLIQVVQDKSSTDDNPMSSDDESKRAENKSVLGTMLAFMTKRHSSGSGHAGTTKETTASEIYLDDLDLENLDPEVAALYFPNFGRDLKNSPRREQDEDVESGKGSSVAQSPAPGSSPKPSHVALYMDDQHRQVQDEQSAPGPGPGPAPAPSKFEAISICGSNLALFEQSQLTYDELVENPDVILNTPPESIVVKLDGQLVPWSAALPQLLSTTFFKRPLSPQLQEKLIGQYIKKDDQLKDGQSSDLTRSDSTSSKDPNAKKAYSWFPWGRRSTATDGDLESHGLMPTSSPPSSSDKPPIQETEVSTTSTNESSQPLQEDVAVTPVNQPLDLPKLDSSSFLNRDSSSSTSSSDESEGGGGGIDDETKIMNRTSRVTPSPSQKPIPPPINISSPHININVNVNAGQRSKEKYKKSLRLTSEQIAALGLLYGQNEAVFSVTTAYQGTTAARCHIYLWRYDDRVVVSDIDGTITKSDVLGHILPIIGQDWAQSGVAQLFTQIQDNGYKMLYLSARAIGQAATTREYLRSIKQGDVTLPDGPLLLNPTSLMSALHREVIEKKPEDFKIACLRDVQTLFPTNPLYAGYGNKINDVWAYRAVEIAISRIFTINHKGELRHALTNTFQSSYTSLVELAEFIFPAYKIMYPPILEAEEKDKSTHSFSTTDGFSAFEFWRAPVPELACDEL